MGTPVETRPRQRYARGEGDRLRDDLLEAAADLMAEHGSVDAVSLRAVARRAGVSPTAVYRHFDDHLQLLRQAVQFCWENFRNALWSAIDASDDPFQAFRSAGDAYVRFAMDNPGQYRVMFSSSIDVGLDPGSPELTAARVSTRPTTTESTVAVSAFELLIDMIAAILDSLDDDRDPFFVSVQVHTWIHGMVDLCANHGEAPWPPMDEMLDGLVSALRLEPPPR